MQFKNEFDTLFDSWQKVYVALLEPLYKLDKNELIPIIEGLEYINKQIFDLNIDLETGQEKVNKVEVLLNKLASFETLFSTLKPFKCANLLKSVLGQLEEICIISSKSKESNASNPTLPNEIIIKEIAPYLPLRDVRSLSLTSKFFYKNLDKIIWQKLAKYKIAAGDHTLILFDEDSVYGCGYNKWGQLGLGHKDNLSTFQCLALPKGKKVLNIATSKSHTLISFDDGSVDSCGGSFDHVLGHSNYQSTLQCLALPGNKKVVNIAAGRNHSLISYDDGSVYGCGNNGYGQLGLGHGNNQSTLQCLVPPGNEKVVNIAAGRNHSLISFVDGSVYGCGDNSFGQLGLRHRDNQSTLQCLKLPKDKKDKKVVNITAGSDHTLFLLNDGSVYGCGFNYYGQLGLGHTKNQSTLQCLELPKDKKDKKVVNITAGSNHTLFLLNDGSVYGCGYNHYGQLGLGHTKSQSTLQCLRLPKATKAINITAGNHHTLILLNNGLIYGCGDNHFGQLGLGHGLSYLKVLEPTLLTIPLQALGKIAKDNKIQHTEKGNQSGCTMMY